MTALLGIPDSLALERINRQVFNVKSAAQRARTEVVTGRIEDVTAEVRGDIGSVHLLRKAIDDAQNYQKSLGLAENRAQRTQTVISSLTNESTRLAPEIYSAVGVGNDRTLGFVANDAEAALRVIISNLNSDAGGRALFSGDAPDRSPLGSADTLLADVRAIIEAGPDLAGVQTALDTYFNDPAGGFATTIYQGGAGVAPAVELSPGVRINPTVKADAQPIRDLLRGLAVVANFNAAAPGGVDGSRALASDSADRLLAAEDDIVEIGASIGVNEAQISQRVRQLEEEEQVLTTLFNDRTVRDPFEAASQLQILETQLESAFLVTARLSRLSLLEFLR